MISRNYQTRILENSYRFNTNNNKSISFGMALLYSKGAKDTLENVYRGKYVKNKLAALGAISRKNDMDITINSIRFINPDLFQGSNEMKISYTISDRKPRVTGGDTTRMTCLTTKIPREFIKEVKNQLKCLNKVDKKK